MIVQITVGNCSRPLYVMSLMPVGYDFLKPIFNQAFPSLYIYIYQIRGHQVNLFRKLTYLIIRQNDETRVQSYL